MAAEPDVRSLAAEMPRLLATLPADAGDVVSVEVYQFDGEPKALVETRKRRPSGLTDHVDGRAIPVAMVEVRRWVSRGGPMAEVDKTVEVLRHWDENANAAQVAFMREMAGAAATPAIGAEVPVEVGKPGPFWVVAVTRTLDGEHTAFFESRGARPRTGDVTWKGAMPSFWLEIVTAHETGEPITAEQLEAWTRSN